MTTTIHITDAGGSFGLTASKAADTARDFSTSAFNLLQITSEKIEYEMSSFFPWMGGKSKVAKRLAELLPQHDCYVEVFAGAAHLLFTKTPSKTEVINDINGDLVNLFRVVRCHPREFIAELKFTLHSRQDFSDYREQPGLTDIQRAARFWFVAKTAFGGKAGTNHPDFGYGTIGKARLRRSAFTAIRHCHRRLDGVFIEHGDFAEVIDRYDRQHSVFFCDPPYLGTAGYQSDFGLEQHRCLAHRLAGIKGKFLVTINDHKDIRRLYCGCEILKVNVKYSISRDKTAAVTDRGELVIANYPLPKRF